MVNNCGRTWNNILNTAYPHSCNNLNEHEGQCVCWCGVIFGVRDYRTDEVPRHGNRYRKSLSIQGTIDSDMYLVRATVIRSGKT